MCKVMVIDIDGILTTEVVGHDYKVRKPNNYNIETLRNYHNRGYKIHLHTSRFNSDRDTTIDWLKRHNVPYDELTMCKPSGFMYVDDLASNQLDREVLCLSGGVDSVVAYFYLNKPSAKYFKVNSRYQRKELESIRQLKSHIDVDEVDGPDIGRYETGTYAYISKRNLMLAQLASFYGNKIYIAGIKGDLVPDKTKEAFDVMSFAMNFIQKVSEPRISIESPFWHHNKYELVKMLIGLVGKDVALDLMYKSISCYDPTVMGQCGACPSCFRKFIAVEYAGLSTDDMFNTNMMNWELVPTYKYRVENGDFDPGRAKATKVILKKYGKW